MNIRPSSALNQNRELIRRVVLSHRSNNPRVFGSVVSGTDTENSDLDLLVDLGENLSPWFPVGLINELESFLGIKVDVVTVNGLKKRIKESVLREAKTL